MGPSEINRPYLILGESLNYIYHIYDFVRSDMRVNIKILFMSNFLTISIKCVPIFSFNLCINCRKVTKFYRLGCCYFATTVPTSQKATALSRIQIRSWSFYTGSGLS